MAEWNLALERVGAFRLLQPWLIQAASGRLSSKHWLWRHLPTLLLRTQFGRRLISLRLSLEVLLLLWHFYSRGGDDDVYDVVLFVVDLLPLAADLVPEDLGLLLVDHRFQAVHEFLETLILLPDLLVEEHVLLFLLQPGPLGRNLIPEFLPLCKSQAVSLGGVQFLLDLVDLLVAFFEVAVVSFSLPTSSLSSLLGFLPLVRLGDF